MRLETEISRAARFEARITEAQKALFQRAAVLGGHRTLTDFVINSAQEKAEAIVRDSEILRLSEKDRQIFVKALLRPPTPNKKLRRAATRYKKQSHTR